MAATRQTAEHADHEVETSRSSGPFVQYALIAGPILAALALAAVLIVLSR
jgi:hypothetical protein